MERNDDMTRQITSIRTRKYRIVAVPSDHAVYPIKYVAQRKWLYWWVEIDWDFDLESTKYGIKQFHQKHYGPKLPPTPIKIIKEFEL